MHPLDGVMINDSGLVVDVFRNPEVDVAEDVDDEVGTLVLVSQFPFTAFMLGVIFEENGISSLVLVQVRFAIVVPLLVLNRFADSLTCRVVSELS